VNARAAVNVRWIFVGQEEDLHANEPVQSHVLCEA
jgi:hypothetical protein